MRLLHVVKHKERDLPNRVLICTARMKKMGVVERRRRLRLKGSYVVEGESEDNENVEWDLDGMSLLLEVLIV